MHPRMHQRVRVPCEGGGEARRRGAKGWRAWSGAINKTTPAILAVGGERSCLRKVVSAAVEVAAEDAKRGVHRLCQTTSIPQAPSLLLLLLSPLAHLVESTMASGITQETSFVARSHVNARTRNSHTRLHFVFRSSNVVGICFSLFFLLAFKFVQLLIIIFVSCFDVIFCFNNNSNRKVWNQVCSSYELYRIFW